MSHGLVVNLLRICLRVQKLQKGEIFAIMLLVIGYWQPFGKFLRECWQRPSESDTVYWGFVPQHSVYEALPTKQMVNYVRGGIQIVNMTHSVGPAGSHTSKPDLTVRDRVSNKIKYFFTFFCDWGKRLSYFFYSQQYKLHNIIDHSAQLRKHCITYAHYVYFQKTSMSRNVWLHKC